MAFNFAGVLDQAMSAMEGNSNNYKYNILYPGGIGITKVKLLFNPSSNSVMRLINRHKIGDEQIPCLRTYEMDCPICKALEDIDNAGGPDLYNYKSKARGISYAQFISSDQEQRRVEPGNIVLFMYPWTVYQQITHMIVQNKNTPENLERLIATNTGFALIVNHTNDNKYNTTIDAFNQHTTSSSESEFDKLLNGLDPLTEQILPSKPTPDMIKDVQNTSAELIQKYLPGAISSQSSITQQPQSAGFTQQPTQQPQSAGFTQQPTPVQSSFQQPQPQPTQQNLSSSNSPNNSVIPNNQISQPVNQPSQQPVQPQNSPQQPPCFGKHGEIDQNQCLLCPVEVGCMEKSGNLPF